MVDKGDMSTLMLKGISNYFDQQLSASIAKRKAYWHLDFSGRNAYERSVLQNRKAFSQMIGITDSLAQQTEMEYVSTTSVLAKVAENEYFTAYAVRWKLFGNVYGEGLLLQPRQTIKARVIAVPDADQTPELLIGTAPGLSPESQYARRLAENGCQVIIPTIINRSDTGSGSARLQRYTNQPHREWIYRQAYTFGRHIIGYEVQKILAVVDWFGQQNKKSDVPIGIVGWGEGGLLGFYSAAIDTRIDVALVSGYFGKREALWKEPIYRNVFGLLREFGDAEIAGLVVPRSLIIEYAPAPDVAGPAPPRSGSGGTRLTASAAPGRIITQSFEEVDSEVKRSKQLTGAFSSSIQFIHDHAKVVKPLNESSLLIFLKQLQPGKKTMVRHGKVPEELRKNFNSEERQLRQLSELENYTQQLIQKSRHVRDANFWDKTPVTTPEAWRDSMKHYQDNLWNDIIGRIPASQSPLNPHSRKIFDEATWAGYEVTLDVLPGVFDWGYLLIPKDIKPGEKRPVMVVQHGGSGLPKDVLDKNSKYYKGLAIKLVERGYIVFAPHFPWREGDNYREIQRKANPLGLSVFSIILNQHQRLLDWLTSQPWVDPDRIGLYGLSWGGKVALRVPALLDRYSLAISSGDFNEWIWKNATTDWQNSYMFVPEYEMFDFNLGRTFNYAEMAALIAPRAFMVERGHEDGVGIDEWVAFEYAKVKRLYDQLKIPEMTRIEYFNGHHEINAKGTLEFIQQYFHWPLPNNKFSEVYSRQPSN
jgi:dienelactone hydrolase